SRATATQSRNCYAKQRLVKWLRMRVTKMIKRRLSKVQIKEAVSLLTRNVLSDALVRRCNPIVPLREMRIRKVRVVRTPKFDAQALLNAHGTIPTSVEADPREVEEAVEAAPAAAKAAE
ncbi:Ribosomal S3Ae family, putative, partial [Leishmania shawi]